MDSIYLGAYIGMGIAAIYATAWFFVNRPWGREK
jgi:hypothetical protein